MSPLKSFAVLSAALAAAAGSAAAAPLKITFTNEASSSGFYLTPVFLAFHDSGADLFNAGEAASAELERLAEDGLLDPLNSLFAANHPAAQTGALMGAIGPIGPGESVSTVIEVDGDQNPLFSFASMLVPSQDAFIGSDIAHELFNAGGAFNGPLEIVLFGDDVYDAGTEQNTDNSAIAFLNQMTPDTGAAENGVIGQHPSLNDFILSQIFIGPNGDIPFSAEAADFTQDGFGPVARITISEVPLPAAVWLFGAGAAALGGAAVRRRRKQAGGAAQPA